MGWGYQGAEVIGFISVFSSHNNFRSHVILISKSIRIRQKQFKSVINGREKHMDNFRSCS